MTSLTVWAGRHAVGHLSHDPGTNRFAFAYTDEWARLRNAFPLCPQLPIRQDEISSEQHSAIVRQFFENLLPEGEALDHAAQVNGISKSNLIGLALALGRETAGAIRLSAGDTPPSEPEVLREIGRPELSQRIADRTKEPFSVWDGQVRLSIAGHQDKIAVYEHERRLYLVNGGLRASTVIVKPVPARPQLAALPGNEFLCMKLARAAGLPVADVWLEYLPQPVLFVRRFDRLARQEAVDRLHMIDGCQALGLSVGMKYERPYGDKPDVREIRDGASLRLLFEVINKYSVQPVVDRMALLRWAIFQVLIGNCDAHGKNVSFFVSPGGLVLAPTYDLVCIPALEDAKLDRTLAMAIGDAFTASEITPFDWAQLGRQAGVRMAAMAKQMQDLVKKTLYGLDAAIDEATQAGVPKEESGRVQAYVVAACQAVADAAKNVAKVDPNTSQSAQVAPATDGAPQSPARD